MPVNNLKEDIQSERLLLNSNIIIGLLCTSRHYYYTLQLDCARASERYSCGGRALSYIPSCRRIRIKIVFAIMTIIAYY
jgi:hypothetical protein